MLQEDIISIAPTEITDLTLYPGNSSTAGPTGITQRGMDVVRESKPPAQRQGGTLAGGRHPHHSRSPTGWPVVVGWTQVVTRVREQHFYSSCQLIVQELGCPVQKDDYSQNKKQNKTTNKNQENKKIQLSLGGKNNQTEPLARDFCRQPREP